MIRHIIHCRGNNQLHICDIIVPARLAICMVFESCYSRAHFDLFTEEVELVLLRQRKMFPRSIRENHIHAGIDGLLTCLADFLLFGYLQLL